MRFTLSLYEDPTDINSTLDTTGPVFKGYQLRALPATPRQHLIQLPLYCYDVETDRYNVQVGYDGRSWERIQALEDLESTGDEVGRNGFASPMAIVQHANRWRSGAYPWEFRDVYIGHYHTHAEWPMANGQGSVYQTGSTESDNRYAGVMLAASATPSQRLHFVDPDKGRVTAAYKIWLD